MRKSIHPPTSLSKPGCFWPYPSHHSYLNHQKFCGSSGRTSIEAKTQSKWKKEDMDYVHYCCVDCNTTNMKGQKTYTEVTIYFRTETGKYAMYCSQALERAVSTCSLTGAPARTAKPSRMEVLSILLKNPHHHSLPHALPVHLANDSYQVG